MITDLTPFLFLTWGIANKAIASPKLFTEEAMYVKVGILYLS